MPSVYMPKKPVDSTQQILTLGGAGIGAAYGGPAGAATGGSLGGMVGGIASNQSQQPGGVSDSADQNAMQRRMMAQQDDNLKTLRDAVTALPQLPPEMRQEYARPVMTAYMAEAKQRGVNPWEGMS